MASAGISHSCALTNRGEIFTWGKMTTLNSHNGDHSTKFLVASSIFIIGTNVFEQEYFQPRVLKARTSSTQTSTEEKPFFIKICSGPTHNAAIDRDGRLFTWGDRLE